jgi:hypothetical protein
MKLTASDLRQILLVISFIFSGHVNGSKGKKNGEEKFLNAIKELEKPHAKFDEAQLNAFIANLFEVSSVQLELEDMSAVFNNIRKITRFLGKLETTKYLGFSDIRAYKFWL